MTQRNYKEHLGNQPKAPNSILRTRRNGIQYMHQVKVRFGSRPRKIYIRHLDPRSIRENKILCLQANYPKSQRWKTGRNQDPSTTFDWNQTKTIPQEDTVTDLSISSRIVPRISEATTSYRNQAVDSPDRDPTAGQLFHTSSSRQRPSKEIAKAFDPGSSTDYRQECTTLYQHHPLGNRKRRLIENSHKHCRKSGVSWTERNGTSRKI